jgi:hypothetical protein
MNQWKLLAACLCLGVSSAWAQDESQLPPPGSQDEAQTQAPDQPQDQPQNQARDMAGRSTEVSELEFFVGHWTTSGQSRATANSEFAPLSGEETCEWFSGGSSVVCRETMIDGNGTVDSIYILAYDPTRRHYTVYGTDANGAIFSGIGTVREGSWDWDAEMRVGETVYPLKYSFRPGDDGGRDMGVQADTGGGSWVEVIQAHYAPGE